MGSWSADKLGSILSYLEESEHSNPNPEANPKAKPNTNPNLNPQP